MKKTKQKQKQKKKFHIEIVEVLRKKVKLLLCLLEVSHFRYYRGRMKSFQNTKKKAFK